MSRPRTRVLLIYDNAEGRHLGTNLRNMNIHTEEHIIMEDDLGPHYDTALTEISNKTEDFTDRDIILIFLIHSLFHSHQGDSRTPNYPRSGLYLHLFFSGILFLTRQFKTIFFLTRPSFLPQRDVNFLSMIHIRQQETKFRLLQQILAEEGQTPPVIVYLESVINYIKRRKGDRRIIKSLTDFREGEYDRLQHFAEYFLIEFRRNGWLYDYEGEQVTSKHRPEYR